MNNYFWAYLSFFVMTLITLKVIILTYIAKINVEIEIVMALIFIIIGLLGLLYLITHKYNTFKFIKKCNISLVSIILLTSVIIAIQYMIMPQAYAMSPNPALCNSILNLNVVFVLLISYYLFHTSMNINTLMGIFITLIGLYLILNN